MATYILIAGAWHGSWCWERVVPILEAAGHRAIAPDLLGMGADATPVSSVTLARWADQIADIIRRHDEKVVLVGHSRGGIVISEIAERVPDRIAMLVYVTALLVPDGDTAGATLATIAGEPPTDLLIPGDDGTASINPAYVGPLFYNLAEADWVARATSRLGPEPMGVFAAPLALSGGGFGSVARAYVECTRDQVLPLDLQRHMQQALPCAPVFTLDADHSPFYSMPDALAECLLTLAD